MELHTDHHFVIGNMHVKSGKPCQDHALSGVISYTKAIYDYDDGVYKDTIGTLAYAVVSDGCSSAGDTDIGSRLVTTSTVNEIKFHASRLTESNIHKSIANFSNICSRQAGNVLALKQADLFATQIFAVVNDDGHGFVAVYGDGVVAFITKSGRINTYSFEWDQNIPYYPLATNDALFEKTHGGPENRALTMTAYSFNKDFTTIDSFITLHTVAEGMNGITLPIQSTDSLICLFTDGVQQVDQIEFYATLQSIVDFRNLTGEFVKRRLIHFVKESQKIGKGPQDDLSLAVIVIDR